MTNKFPKLTLKAGEGRRVERGHLWVFSNEVAQLEKSEGDEVSVYSAKGKFIGNALLSNSALIRARIYSRIPEPCDEVLLRKRLIQAIKYRETIGFKNHSYRLCFSEGDFLPGLTIDIYGEHIVVQITTTGMDARREMIVSVLVDLLKPKSIYERSDVFARTLENLEMKKSLLYGTLDTPCEIIEDGTSILIDIAEGQKTGFFLDQVANRQELTKFAKGRRVLDLFSYVGAWSLVLAKNGATEAIGVDSSGKAIALAEEAAEKNNLSQCKFMEEDAFDALKVFAQRGEQFDLIVVDPPPLAKSRKDIQNALRAYNDLNLRAMRLLSANGILATASCSHHILTEDFLQMLRMASRDAKVDLRLFYTGSQAPDHPIHLNTPETAYLKFYAFYKM